MSQHNADPLRNWCIWVRKGNRRWRLFGRAPTQQLAEALARTVEVGLDKLIRQGGDPNEDTRR
jgi:hypothetical protein